MMSDQKKNSISKKKIFDFTIFFEIINLVILENYDKLDVFVKSFGNFREKVEKKIAKRLPSKMESFIKFFRLNEMRAGCPHKGRHGHKQPKKGAKPPQKRAKRA